MVSCKTAPKQEVPQKMDTAILGSLSKLGLQVSEVKEYRGEPVPHNTLTTHD